MRFAAVLAVEIEDGVMLVELDAMDGRQEIDRMSVGTKAVTSGLTIAREIIRKHEPDQSRRPGVHLGS